MAGGQYGVQRVLDILSKEIKTTLQLMGASPALINSTVQWFDCAPTELIWALLALERCGHPGVHGYDQARGARELI